MPLPPHSTIEVGSLHYVNGVAFRVEAVTPPDDPDDGPYAPLSVDLSAVQISEANDDEVELFKALWELADAVPAPSRPESRVAFALAGAFGLYDARTWEATPSHLLPPDLDIDSWRMIQLALRAYHPLKPRPALQQSIKELDTRIGTYLNNITDPSSGEDYLT